jgi:hypothetical protein
MSKYVSMIFPIAISTILIFLLSCPVLSNSNLTVNESSDIQLDQTLFFENFDKTILNTIPAYWSFDYWTADSTSDIFIGVVNTGVTPVSGHNCLKLWDYSSTASAGVNRVIGEQNYGQLKFKVYLDSTSPCRQATLFISSSNNNKIEFNINSAGTISVKNQSGSRANVGNCTLDSWHTIEAKWDRLTGYYRFFLDNIDYGAYPMLDQEIPNKIRIRSGNTDDPTQNNSIVYIDNVEFKIKKITLGPVPISGFFENFEATTVGGIPGDWGFGYTSDGTEC